ncbi:MAG: hypothetical protein V2A34_01755 [Lentisphaerota bacterium]
MFYPLRACTFVCMEDQSWLNKTLRFLVLAGPFVLVLLLAWTPGISFQEDLGRHLLLGQIILETHQVPETNLLTYTHPDYPFVNHHWLSEVLLYLLHRPAGLNGLIVWKMLMMGAAMLLALLAVSPKRPSGLYWVAGLSAAVLLGFRAHIRPELLTYLLVAFFLWSFEKIRKGNPWLRWLLVPAIWLWANLHIYFMFGLFMALAFSLEQIWKSHRAGPFTPGGQAWRESLWLLVMMLACLVNPHGLKGLMYPLLIFQNYGMSITENESPLGYWHSVLNPMLLALPAMSALILFASAKSMLQFHRLRDTDQLRPANIAVALVALIASWFMARSVPLLALTALPVIGAELPSARRHSIPRAVIRGMLLLAAMLLNAWLIHGVVTGWFARVFPSPIAPTPFGFDSESRYSPLKRLAAAGLKGPVFSDYNIGSLVEYELYPEPGYVDNRPEAFPSAFWRAEYMPALALAERWKQVCETRRINAVIVSLPGVKEAFTQELMRRPEWVLVWLDDFCGVWVRNHADNKRIIDASVFDAPMLSDYVSRMKLDLEGLSSRPWWRRQVEADQLVYKCYSLICIGQPALAWPLIEKLHQLYPDYQIVHELMRVTAPQDQVALVESVMRRRARWPVAAKQVMDYGRFLLAQGRVDEALKVFQRGRWFFPLSPALREAVENLVDADYVERTFVSPSEKGTP